REESALQCVCVCVCVCGVMRRIENRNIGEGILMYSISNIHTPIADAEHGTGGDKSIAMHSCRVHLSSCTHTYSTYHTHTHTHTHTKPQTNINTMPCVNSFHKTNPKPPSTYTT